MKRTLVAMTTGADVPRSRVSLLVSFGKTATIAVNNWAKEEATALIRPVLAGGFREISSVSATNRQKQATCKTEATVKKYSVVYRNVYPIGY